MTEDSVSTDREFTVVLAKSGRRFTVLAGHTIMETLLNAGLELPCNCNTGICGGCKTGVLEGLPDHRDGSLTTAERESNKWIIICCSGSKTERLVLDL